MKRARPPDVAEIEEGIEQAEKRARETVSDDDGGRILVDLLLQHFKRLGPGFTWREWSSVTQAKAQWSGLGPHAETYSAGWQAICFRDFESAVRIHDGRGAYPFLSALDAHYRRRVAELAPGQPPATTWLRGYWRRAYVVCNHFLYSMYGATGLLDIAAGMLEFQIHGEELVNEAPSDRLMPHTPAQRQRIDPNWPIAGKVPRKRTKAQPSIDYGAMAMDLPAGLGLTGPSLEIRLTRASMFKLARGPSIAMFQSGAAVDPETMRPTAILTKISGDIHSRSNPGLQLYSAHAYDPLVTVSASGRDYAPDALRGAEFLVDEPLRQISLSLPYGGRPHARPIRWGERTIALGTLQVATAPRPMEAKAPSDWQFDIYLAFHAVDAEWFAYMFQTPEADAEEDEYALNEFPIDMDMPEEWRGHAFIHQRRFLRGTDDTPLTQVLQDIYIDPSNSIDWIHAFCCVPDYAFFSMLPGNAGNAWLDQFDRRVMMETDYGGNDLLRDRARRLVIYSCAVCGNRATHAVLETEEMRCPNCTSS